MEIVYDRPISVQIDDWLYVGFFQGELFPWTFLPTNRQHADLHNQGSDYLYLKKLLIRHESLKT